MGKRWDLTVSRKGKGDKSYYTKVGVIFEGDRGELMVRIDPGIAITATEGVYITGYLPRERDEGARSQAGNGGPRGQAAVPPADDSEIPF